MIIVTGSNNLLEKAGVRSRTVFYGRFRRGACVMISDSRTNTKSNELFCTFHTQIWYTRCFLWKPYFPFARILILFYLFCVSLLFSFQLNIVRIRRENNEWVFCSRLFPALLEEIRPSPLSPLLGWLVGPSVVRDLALCPLPPPSRLSFSLPLTHHAILIASCVLTLQNNAAGVCVVDDDDSRKRSVHTCACVYVAIRASHASQPHISLPSSRRFPLPIIVVVAAAHIRGRRRR